MQQGGWEKSWESRQEPKQELSHAQEVRLLLELVVLRAAALCLLDQSCLTLWTPWTTQSMEILQTRILKWVAYPFSRGSSPPRNQTGSPALHTGGFITN